MTAPCRVCGRACEVSESGQVMPCSCINHWVGRVIWAAIADCVGLAALPSLEVLPERATCATCGANWRLTGPCEDCKANR